LLKPQRVAVVGATSSIGRALAGELAAHGARLHLMARDPMEAGRVQSDLQVRYGAAVTFGLFDASQPAMHGESVTEAVAALGGLDLAVVAVGDLGDQRAAEADFAQAQRIIDANYAGLVSVLGHLANYFEKQRHGAILAITSVAADRGRRSNYFYGSAKAGLDRFLQGLRARLYAANVRVLTVKPGYVDSRMTFGRVSVLIASPQQVARAALRSLRRGRSVVYVPWFWFWIMLLVRAVPESVFRRLS
jgi:short-subunit dehydrogenase